MTPQDIKTLVALAKACRKVGIKSFKSADYEFTLDHAPIRAERAKRDAKANSLPVEHYKLNENVDEITHEELSEEAKLFWSSTSSLDEEQQQGVS
jgi:hypothetical protein